MCMQVPSGRMAEEFGGKWIVAVSLIGSAVVNMITPLMTNWLSALIVSRIVLGFLQGGIFPSCYGMLYKWMPQSERSLALDFMDVGSTIGSIVAASLTGYLSEYGFAGGWPSAFYVSVCLWIIGKLIHGLHVYMYDVILRSLEGGLISKWQSDAYDELNLSFLYNPSGSHLPQGPPIPPYILKALAYMKEHPWADQDKYARK